MFGKLLYLENYSIQHLVVITRLFFSVCIYGFWRLKYEIYTLSIRLKRDRSIHSRVAKNVGNAFAYGNAVSNNLRKMRTHIAKEKKKYISVEERAVRMRKRDDMNLSQTVDRER